MLLHVQDTQRSALDWAVHSVQMYGVKPDKAVEVIKVRTAVVTRLPRAINPLSAYTRTRTRTRNAFSQELVLGGADEERLIVTKYADGKGDQIEMLPDACIHYNLEGAALWLIETGRSDASQRVAAAARANKFVVLWRLKESGTINWDGRMPLSWAAENGHVESVKALLAFGARVNERDTEDGETAMDKAIRYNHEAVHDILKAAGGKTSDDLSEMSEALIPHASA